jgi:uncharacterized membrane protein
MLNKSNPIIQHLFEDFMASNIQTAIKRMKRATLKVEPPVEPNPAQEQKELAKYKDELHPRADSRSIKDILNLYDVKGETSYEYKHNIMEDAHPKSLIMFPAYDKMNALVENHIERQKINLNILRKPVSGDEYRQKYASELLTALTAIANEMDFRDNEPLRKLADKTISHLTKEAFDFGEIGDWAKEKLHDVEDVVGGAGTGAAIGAIAGGLIGAFGGPWDILPGIKGGAIAGGAIAGLISSIEKTGPVAKNVAINAKQAKSKIDNLIKDHPDDIFLSTLSTALGHIQVTAASYASIVSQAKSDKPADPSAVSSLAQSYIDEIQNLDQMLDTFLENASSGKYTSDESDLLAKIESPLQSIFGSEVSDAEGAVRTLEQVSKQAIASITQAKTHAASIPDTSSDSTLAVPAQPTSNHLDELENALRELKG